MRDIRLVEGDAGLWRSGPSIQSTESGLGVILPSSDLTFAKLFSLFALTFPNIKLIPLKCAEGLLIFCCQLRLALTKIHLLHENTSLCKDHISMIIMRGADGTLL